MNNERAKSSSSLRIAVIGGGTAGFMAAAHVRKYYPKASLFHIYDPQLPPIGVGEGTVASFPEWLKSVTGLDELQLQAFADCTRKYAIQFEGWGQLDTSFHHNFYPKGEAFGYHISAAKLVEVLSKTLNNQPLTNKVAYISSTPSSAIVHFDDKSTVEVDYVMDARGYPNSTEILNNSDIYKKFNEIPTNRAIIYSCPAQPELTYTRSVARPWGWIFGIPLSSRTSYGYVFNQNITSDDIILEDFNRFFEEENISPTSLTTKSISFPNFSRKVFFDGRVIYLGNNASFLEPLEATAIHFTSLQISIFGKFPLATWPLLLPDSELWQQNCSKLNSYLYSHISRIALFVSWHYALGSNYDTAFWQYAKAIFQERISKENQDSAVDDFLASIKQLESTASPNSINSAMVDSGPQQAPFALWTHQSFVEMSKGLGYVRGGTNCEPPFN